MAEWWVWCGEGREGVEGRGREGGDGGRPARWVNSTGVGVGRPSLVEGLVGAGLLVQGAGHALAVVEGRPALHVQLIILFFVHERIQGGVLVVAFPLIISVLLF
jgi:hypothetical protein